MSDFDDLFSDIEDVERILALCRHPDVDVRLRAADALTSLEALSPSPEAIAAMIALTSDDDENVRDWATFDLGTQFMADSHDIRQALRDRLQDDNDEVRHEAYAGLARRHDPGITEVIREALQQKVVWRLAVDAARLLRSPELLGPLKQLRTWWDVDAELLNDAIDACDPQKHEAERAMVAELTDAVTAAIAAKNPSMQVSSCCDLFDGDVNLLITMANGETATSYVAGLMKDRDIEEAASFLANDIDQDSTTYVP